MFANGVPRCIGSLTTAKPSSPRRSVQAASVRPKWRPKTLAAQQRDQAIDPVADREAAPRRGVADAQDQAAALGQGGAGAREQRVLVGDADVVEDVEQDDGIDRAEGRRPHVGADEVGAVAERAPGARDVACEQLDAAHVDIDRRRGPGVGQRPWRAAAPAARDQAGEQALAAADVEHARARRDHAAREQVAEDRIPAQLAAREVPGEAARALVRRARRRDERAPGELARRRRSWRGRRAAARRERRRRQRHRPQAARLDALEQGRQDGDGEQRGRRSRCAPHCRRGRAGCRRRRAGVPAARAARPDRVRTVSKPRRVQLTSCRSRRCSTGCRNGLRRPAGARKKRGARAGDVGQARLRGADLARHRPRAEQREGVRMAVAVVLHAVAAGDDLAAQARLGARARADAEEGRAHGVRVEQVEDRWRHGRIGAVVDRDRDFAARRRGRRQAPSSCCRASASAARDRRR